MNIEIHSFTDLKTQYLKFLCSEMDYISDYPSFVIVSAHQDDEAIGIGGQIPRLRNVTFIHTTDGAPGNMTDAHALGFNSKEEYAKKRYNEFCDALSAAGIIMPSCIELGYPDQESSFNLVQMTNDLSDIFNVIKPDVIITHSYEGGHPDHDSAAFAVHSALKGLNLNEGDNMPVLLEFSSYHSDSGRMSTFEFLPEKTCLKVVTRLSDEQCRLKKKMFDCFETQRNVLQYFPIETECFRNAPVYDFTRAPHEGKLYYEYYDWGVKGDQWRKLAKEAIEKLNLRE